MQKSVYFAGQNKGKYNEFVQLFPEFYLEFNQGIEVAETGNSFQENAFIKAEYYYKTFKKPSLSDDSGLCVDALPNDLGVYSARFGEPHFNDLQRNEFLLEKMKDIPFVTNGLVSPRTAQFICCLCYYLSPKEVYFFQGILKGYISRDALGSDGFGYDPIFIPNVINANPKELTLAQLGSIWKNIHGHRAKAVKEMKAFLS